ncbi:MAG: 16S rRNA (guanine(966)-N(2))-methyltransferase RsmD [bacterium]|nr:16S rRNA (guanine(966)-N(2))-methyltransferase RsmD [bacterium]
MSLRIIGGRRRGTILNTPSGLATRPTLGRVRTSLFGILTPAIPGAAVLDAFAGSGALGLEALSRGAARADFVEQSASALAALRANVARLDWADRAHIYARDALAFLNRPEPPAGESYDLIFLDPPYGHDLCAESLRRLAAHAPAWLSGGGWIAAQAGRKDRLDETYGDLARVRGDIYSRTRIDFYRRAR